MVLAIGVLREDSISWKLIHKLLNNLNNFETERHTDRKNYAREHTTVRLLWQDNQWQKNKVTEVKYRCCPCAVFISTVSLMYYAVVHKNVTFLFCLNNSVRSGLISIIVGIHIPEGICNLRLCFRLVTCRQYVYITLSKTSKWYSLRIPLLCPNEK